MARLLQESRCIVKLFDHLLVPYTGVADNLKTDCLHCGSSNLSVDVEAPHQYQCWSCKQTGNCYSYIRKWYDNLPPLTKQQAVNLCNQKKGLQPIILREVGIRFYNNCYWFPVYNNKNHLVAVHKYVPDTNIWYSSPKPTSLTIIGLNNLTKSDTVWVCEGHPDYLTLLPQMVNTGIDLLGTCGSYFNSAHLPVLKDRHIVLLYDNDLAGIDGVDYVARHLKANSIQHLSLSFLDWNKITLPHGELISGFDIRDLNNTYAGAQ